MLCIEHLHAPPHSASKTGWFNTRDRVIELVVSYVSCLGSHSVRATHDPKGPLQHVDASAKAAAPLLGTFLT